MERGGASPPRVLSRRGCAGGPFHLLNRPRCRSLKEQPSRQTAGCDDGDADPEPADGKQQPCGGERDARFDASAHRFDAHVPCSNQDDGRHGRDEPLKEPAHGRQLSEPEVAVAQPQEKQERRKDHGGCAHQGPLEAAHTVAHISHDIHRYRPGQDRRQGDAIQHVLRAEQFFPFHRVMLHDGYQRHETAERGAPDLEERKEQLSERQPARLLGLN